MADRVETVSAVPQVSVILPCYNAASHIEKTLESIANQSYRLFEVCAVDDGSSDNTQALLQLWKQKIPALRVFSLKQNSGPGIARNLAIKHARCDLIALIDSDDIWYPDKLSKQVALHNKTDCAFSCTGFTYRRKHISPSGLDYYSLLKNNVVNTSTVMFDRSKIDISFRSVHKSEDYIAWLNVAKQVEVYSLADILALRCDNDGISSNKIQMALQRWKVYRQIEGLGWFNSIYYFVHYAVSGMNKHVHIRLF